MIGALRPRRHGGLALLALIILVLPLFIPNAYVYDVVILVGINGIVCIGLNLLIGYAGQISLGHAGFFGLGAYASAVLSETYGWPPLLALVAGAVGVGLVSFVVARPILKLKGHYLAMATLGLGIIVSIVLNQEGRLTGGPDGMAVPEFSVIGLVLAGERAWYWLVGGLLLLTAWLTLNLVDSPVGRALSAIHGAETAAMVAGIDVLRYKVMVFVLSAVLASVAGSLYAHYAGFITPSEATFFRSIEFVTMVVLGGMASTFGAIAGALILTALPQFLTQLQDYQMLTFGAVLVGTMVFLPKGLVPSVAERFARRRR